MFSGLILSNLCIMRHEFLEKRMSSLLVSGRPCSKKTIK